MAKAENEPKKKNSKAANMLSLQNLDADDDGAGGFLNVNRKIVKTAHEPKPPKDLQEAASEEVQIGLSPKNEPKKVEKTKKKPVKKDSKAANMLSLKSLDDDGGDAGGFLNVNRKIVKTAHEPKPPKELQEAANEEELQQKARVSISMGNKKKKDPPKK